MIRLFVFAATAFVFLQGFRCASQKSAGSESFFDPSFAQSFKPRTSAPMGQKGCQILAEHEQKLCEEGQRLFSNKDLSHDGQVSCATCHAPNTPLSPLKFSDGRARPFVRGKALPLPRTPSLLDVSRTAGPFFWNGRARTLAAQPFWPLYAASELGASPASLLPFGGAAHVATALATFMQSLQSGPAPFDAWLSGNFESLTPQELTGAQLVLSQKNCAVCHEGTELRGTKTHLLRYSSLPQYALLKQESSYSADAELAQLVQSSARVLGSVPPTLRNLAARNLVYGRYGQFNRLSEFLQMHSRQPLENALQSHLSAAENASMVSFLLVGLRSQQLAGEDALNGLNGLDKED